MCFVEETKPRVIAELERFLSLPVDVQHAALRELFQVNYSDDLVGDLEWAIKNTTK